MSLIQKRVLLWKKKVESLMRLSESESGLRDAAVFEGSSQFRVKLSFVQC